MASNDIIDNLLNDSNTPAAPEEEGAPADGNVFPSADTPAGAEFTGRRSSPASANDINVHIANRLDPIVVLFGPSGCGKTMSLLRLTRYLNENGYDVKPRRDFRPDNDDNYRTLCDNWDSTWTSDLAAIPTSHTNFMLLTVKKQDSPDNRCICQILEAPGELYFDASRKDPAKAPFPPYLETIKSAKNRKIWCIMLEPEWGNPAIRNQYVKRIALLKKYIRPTDKTIFIYNKIDKTDMVFMGSRVLSGALQRSIEEEYEGVFNYFRNTNPVSRLWKSHTCDLLPFSTGSFAENSLGAQTYTPGDDDYPRDVWARIRKHIRG